MRAVISVFNKTGVADFARGLAAQSVEVFSTGGTHRAIAEAGVRVKQVSELTGFPEILDGRVKTLHPRVHGGLLARRDVPAHLQQLRDLDITPIDIVVVNLYPFVQAVSTPEVALMDALEQIDIGGPTLLRAAAKNFPWVTVLVDPADYGTALERLKGPGFSQEERRALAVKAFRHVSVYDAAISAYLARGLDLGPLPPELPMGFRQVQTLRYGENPHQQAALYAPSLGASGLAAAVQHQGKEMSFNNLLDADAAWRTVTDFAETAAVVIKHTNACGLAVRADQVEAYKRALEGDPVSAYGGIVGFNRGVTAETARAMAGVFYEVIVAPGYEPEALQVFAKRSKNLRVLEVPTAPGLTPPLDVRPITGGMLVQTPDAIAEDPASWRVVTRRKPTPQELADLAFAWKAAKHIKSNAIVLAKDRMITGMGAGQPNRVTSVAIAIKTSGDRVRGTVMASDAFFPFPDSIVTAHEAGVTAVAHPGGSIRDEEVIAAADERGMAMVFTGIRHFRH